MRDPKIQQIFRQFAENGIKLLLENRQNVRDLLALTAADVVKMIDFSRLKPVFYSLVRGKMGQSPESPCFLGYPPLAAAHPGATVFRYTLTIRGSK